MFGIREEEQVPKELYAQARSTYENGENRKEPVRIYAMIQAGEPAQVAVQDKEGHVVRTEGPTPEPARNVPLTAEKVQSQLSRTGGTPYACEKALVHVEEGLSLPLSTLNNLRRQVLDELSAQRVVLPERRQEQFHPGVRYENFLQAPVLTVSVRNARQISDHLLELHPALLYIPAEELSANPKIVERCRRYDVPVAVNLPRICFDRELGRLEEQLLAARELGVEEALCGTLGMLRRAQSLGFGVHGDFGLGV